MTEANQALATNPADSSTLLALAESLLNLGRLEEAPSRRADSDRAIAVGKTEPCAISIRSAHQPVLAATLGRCRLDRFERGDPTSSLGQTEYFNVRGNLFRGTKSFDKARKDFAEAIRLEPGLGASYSNRGLTSLEQGDLDAALLDLIDLSSLLPS